MKNKYKTPPVIEAICEFRFIPGPEWDMTFPGLFYNIISGENQFPIKEEVDEYKVSMRSISRGVLEHTLETACPRMRFFNKERTTLIQLIPDRLIINHLKPYPEWDTFKSLIFENLEKYKNIVMPKEIEYISLRYINRIDFKKSEVKLEDYFNYYPHLGEGLPQKHLNFDMKVFIPFDSEGGMVELKLFSPIEGKSEVSIILDITFSSLSPDVINFDIVGEWIEKAHDKIEEIFEACCTEKAKTEIFEKVNE